jgi:hypothetical protein
MLAGQTPRRYGTQNAIHRQSHTRYDGCHSLLGVAGLENLRGGNSIALTSFRLRLKEDGDPHADLSAALIASVVCWPTHPSTSQLCDCWNAETAAFVA